MKQANNIRQDILEGGREGGVEREGEGEKERERGRERIEISSRQLLL